MALSFSQGAFESTDVGRHWKALSRQSAPALTVITADPQNPRTLYLGDAGGALLKSGDRGAHWVHADRGLDGTLVIDITVDPADAARVYAVTAAGIFRSADGGGSWQAAAVELSYNWEVYEGGAHSLLALGSRLLVGSALDGVLTSADHGLTWHTGAGLLASSIVGLAISPQSPPRLYALDPSRGLFKTASRGASWLRLDGLAAPQGFASFLPVAVSPRYPQTVYAGLFGGVSRSENGGRRWSAMLGLPCVYSERLALDPIDAEVFYASGSFCQPVPACIAYRVDRGEATCLRDTSFEGVPILGIDPNSPNHLFGATGSTLEESSDGGTSWSAVASVSRAYRLAFDPAHSGTLFVASNLGLERSIDGGTTWQPVGAGLPLGSMSLVALLVAPTHPAIIYAASSEKVFASTDSGATFAPLGTGLEGQIVTDLVLDPVNPSILYAATLAGGVMMLQR